MQIQKEAIKTSILSAARAEFISVGFEKASIRHITAIAQTSKSNIYNYFKDKDDLFCAVVEPALKAEESFFKDLRWSYQESSADTYGLDAQKAVMMDFMTLIFMNSDDFRLLFFRAAGSSLAGFQHRLIQSLADALESWIIAVAPQKTLSKLFYRSVAGFYVSTIEQMLLDTSALNNTERHLDEFLKFAYGGWSNILS